MISELMQALEQKLQKSKELGHAEKVRDLKSRRNIFSSFTAFPIFHFCLPDFSCH